MKPKVAYKIASHKEKNVIFIYFDYDAELIVRVKKLVGVQWSQSQKAWYVLDTVQNREKFGLEQKVSLGKEALSNIKSINWVAMERYLETLQLKAYSPKTIITYRNEFGQLLQILKEVDVNSLDAEKLRSYFLYCTTELKLSENTLHSRMNAVKFYFEQVLKRERLFLKFQDPKRLLNCQK